MIDHALWASWRERLLDCAASGLVISEYCRQHNINPRKYYYWKVQIERADGLRPYPQHLTDGITSSAQVSRSESPMAKSPQVAKWVSLSPASEPHCAAGGGIKVRVGSAEIEVTPGFDTALLRSVVQALAG